VQSLSSRQGRPASPGSHMPEGTWVLHSPQQGGDLVMQPAVPAGSQMGGWLQTPFRQRPSPLHAVLSGLDLTVQVLS
jgi:hypothetical protein